MVEISSLDKDYGHLLKYRAEAVASQIPAAALISLDLFKFIVYSRRMALPNVYLNIENAGIVAILAKSAFHLHEGNAILATDKHFAEGLSEESLEYLTCVMKLSIEKWTQLQFLSNSKNGRSITLSEWKSSVVCEFTRAILEIPDADNLTSLTWALGKVRYQI